MTKVLYLVMSGEEAPTRFDMAVYSAMKLDEEKRFESLKILFFGESESILAKATGDRAQNLKKLIDAGVIDSACVGIAKRKNIVLEIQDKGVTLENYRDRISYYLEQGYSVISF
ncbi:MAG: hypothetical protein M1161_02995 [Candidatus Thermoplasmatota archaeon]|jgi:hypothetical protein|nr:hypothetical protein [Candidatus Thermoplasmatota archaeon]MCL5874291.1 hypothetical protein [Candidatus Thermoplasmatota archaeon]